MSLSEKMRQEGRETPTLRIAWGLGVASLVGAGYYLAARLAYAFSFQPSGVAVVWVPAGFMLALLILLDKRRWPFALAGAFVGNTLADMAVGLSLSVSLAGATANSIEVLLAAWLVVRFLGSPISLNSLKEVLGLVVGAAVLSNAVTALLGATVLARGARDFGKAWFVWWIGDGIGMLIVAPVILTWVGAVRAGLKPRRHQTVEALFLFAVMVVVANYVLGNEPSPGAFPNPNPYMTFPFLFWAALRFGPTGAATATLVLSAVTAWHAARGVGFFAAAGESPMNHVFEAYAYLSFASLSSLIPAAVLSERKRTEVKLVESEQQYRDLFESNPHPMWIFDPETLAFLAVNDAAIYQYGFAREEFLAMTIKDIRPPEEILRLLADVEAGHTGHDTAGIWKHRKKNGTVFEVEVVSHGLTWLGRRAKVVLATDVNERQHLQNQLHQAQKMEAVGRLAGGIAHDFNNLLGVIIGYSEIALMNLQGDDPLREKVQEIKKAGERAAGLTRQLLAFSRKEVVEPRVFGLNSVIADLSQMLQRTIGEHIRLLTIQGEGLGRVKADPGRIEQVIVNLAVNARDAMPSGGRLTIETANVILDETYARSHFPVVPGRYVMLAVSDTGVGMDAETQRRLFEPFFTTKEKDKGTGLGLSTAYGIVKQASGYVWVYSELNKGTTFKVYLPRVDEAEEAVPKTEAARSLAGTETILLVEDAEGLRKLAHECLESKGYRVLAAKDAAEALDLAKQNAGPIHLLMTDVVLPGIGGPELTRQLASTHPETRVLYMSGYTDNAIVHHGVLEPGVAFLQKPFVLTDLWRKVREVLDGGRQLDS